ncbi:MAG TPA: TMEM175 family protein [Candidatus Dormibacteraeota bacterium]|nr:TMEM175 family protein [Candidatus Dormibacteraeota bacterium]
MEKNRLEAFSDGVIAIIITIMVLEMKVPDGANWPALKPLLPVFFSYLLSYVYVGIYWNNHHHLLKASRRINGNIMWANLHLLFWLSLFPFVTGWMGRNGKESLPSALYGGVLLLAAIAYYILQTLIIAQEGGPQSKLAHALGKDWKGKASPILYALAIGLSFVESHVAGIIYVLVALMWLIPDKRIERVIKE